METLQVSAASSSPLRLEPGSLAHLPSLVSLDLSGSVVQSIPAGELCRLPNLAALNMSRSELGSVHDLGISGSQHRDCLPLLGSLDLSHNELSMVEGDSLLSWPSIHTLNLGNNYISLHMNNNQMSHLPATLLSHQTNLEQLDLSGNILMETGLPTNLTADLHNLLRLDLCSNQLGRLPSALTAPLQNLQVLRLCNNALATASLSPDMVNLAELDLSGNQLTSLGPSSLQPFSQLTYLCLARNALTEVHSAAFQGTTGLLVLDLSDNKLAGLPKALKSLSGLQTLDISNNLVTNLDEDTLSQLPSLWRL